MRMHDIAPGDVISATTEADLDDLNGYYLLLVIRYDSTLARGGAWVCISATGTTCLVTEADCHRYEHSMTINFMRSVKRLNSKYGYVR